MRDEQEGFCSTNDIPSTVVEPLKTEFGHVVKAADRAYHGDERVKEVEGVSETTFEKLAEASPLNPPGDWTGGKTSEGGYQFTVNGVVIHLSPAEDGWTLSYIYDGDEPFETWRLEQVNIRPLVPAWWSAKSAMERNPHGPGSTIPRNVEHSDQWRLWANTDTKAGWERDSFTERVSVTTNDETSKLNIIYSVDGPRRSELTTIATGSEREMIELVEPTLVHYDHIVDRITESVDEADEADEPRAAAQGGEDL